MTASLANPIPILILDQFLFSAPVFLVWLVGMILALATWRRHPLVSILVILGLLVLCFTTVMGHVLIAWMPEALGRQGRSITQITSIMSLVAVVRSVFGAVGWLLVLSAIFVGRKQPGKVPTGDL